MRLLLDTQIAIWALENNPQLKPPIRLLLEDSTNEILVSHFSLMELAIKLKLGKLPDFIISLSIFIQQLQNDGFTILPCYNPHIIAYEAIPLFDDHRDPFDRFLLATALAEQIPIISADDKFPRYRPLIEIID
jgi:PIN domain nuclease of toxin-antitoxin system